MAKRAAIIATLSAAALGAIWSVLHRAVVSTNKLERRLEAVTPSGVTGATLPYEVRQLAARLGAKTRMRGVFAFRQTGLMWFTPDGRARRFVAEQTAAVACTGFIWTARMGIGGVISITDRLVDGVGALTVRLIGLIPLARETGAPELNQGETLRYLAELPLNPDAILSNLALDWTIISPSVIQVGLGLGSSRAEVTIELGPLGLPSRIAAASRGYLDHGKYRPLPWAGRFEGYERFSGRLIPTRAEAAWEMDGKEFVYWRGTVRDWSPTAPDTPS